MCGISGFIDPAAAHDAERLSVIAQSMAGTIAHRGPDDADSWVDPEAGIAFGHRRLSIIDLSQHGHQPMRSHSGRYVIAYNGELYNFADIRRELAALGHTFAGHSDTEVLLAAIEQWGLVAAISRFTGMFAFAVWDRAQRLLHLVRDRIGEKPLYYGWAGDVFLFGSELKALRAHPRWEGRIDTDALTLYLRFGYVPAPASIYAGISKLRPGCVLTVSPAGSSRDEEPVEYWSLREAALRGTQNPFAGNEAEATDALESLLSSAVRNQMVADVPLGAFLSGGLDSSTVVALMQAQSSDPVRTFTIGFHETGWNEAEHAKAVARHLGTDHTELYVTPKETMDVVPLLPQMYDEPFADSSQIPTHLVSRLARQHVTVSLSGDGGDELFGGYNRYVAGSRIWRQLAWIPRPARSVAGGAIDMVGASRWDAFGRLAGRVGGSRKVAPRMGEKMLKIATVMRAGGPEAVYKFLISASAAPEEFVAGGTEPRTMLDTPLGWPAVGGFAEQMMYLDTMTYLPDDILAKVDRASMACSLESRAPFLDHRVVEFAWTLPLHMKIRGTTGKWLLRQVLYRHVPQEIIERPKMGFGIPVGGWLRGPLREWAESLLDERRLRDEGFLNVRAVRQAWTEHLTGRYDRQLLLWAVLMFQAWLEATSDVPARSLRVATA